MSSAWRSSAVGVSRRTRKRRTAVSPSSVKPREKQFWPGQSAVGQRIYLDGFERPPVEVIGVSRDHKVRLVGEAPRPYLYLTPERSSRIALVVKTAGPSDAALPALRQAIGRWNPTWSSPRTCPRRRSWPRRCRRRGLARGLLGAFGLLALLLSTVGLYGVVAYAVSLRTREVGIRMALGAERRQVLWMMFRQGGRLALAGLVLGAIASAAVGRLIDALLYGVSGFDPVAYAAAASALLGVAALANLVPALGASRIDPMRALRND